MIGNEWAVEMLKAHIHNNQVRHAYLICGPVGVGRRTLALRFAQALSCENPVKPGEPCFQCRTCKQIEAMQYADLLVVQLDETHEKVLVDQVRDLQRNLSLHPYSGRYKFALLRNFDLASESTENSLLKTLEEPPESVILIITAETPEKLTPTIVSRCEVLRLRAMPLDRLTSVLQDEAGVSSEEACILSHASAGKPGLALRLAQNREMLDVRDSDFRNLFSMLSATASAKFVFADKCSKGYENPARGRARLRELLGNWRSFWRDVLVASQQTPVPVYNLEYLSQIQSAANLLDAETAGRSMRLTEHSLQLLDKNINPRLVIEVLLLDLPYIRLQF